MDDDGRRFAHELATLLEEGEVKIAVLPPGQTEALVESTGRLQSDSLVEAVGRREGGMGEVGSVQLLIGGGEPAPAL